MRPFLAMMVTGFVLGFSAAVLATTIDSSSPTVVTGATINPAGITATGQVQETTYDPGTTCTTAQHYIVPGGSGASDLLFCADGVADVSFDRAGNALIGGMLGVTGASTLAAVAETGQHTNTLVATSGSSYTDVTMATGASIYQHQASTASYKAYECWKTDGVSEWICIGVSSGGGASPALAMNGGTNHDEMYVPAAGGYALDVNGSRAQTSSAALTTFPSKVSNTANSGTCTLNGGTPSTCTATVTAGAICTCSDVGTTAAIAAGGCSVSVSSTTLTITGAVAATNNVNFHCDR